MAKLRWRSLLVIGRIAFKLNYSEICIFVWEEGIYEGAQGQEGLRGLGGFTSEPQDFGDGVTKRLELVGPLLELAATLVWGEAQPITVIG